MKGLFRVTMPYGLETEKKQQQQQVLRFIISADSHGRMGGSNAVEVVGSFVKLLRQQNKKNYDPTLSALDALAVASFIFLARSVTPPLYVVRRFLRARSVS